MRGTKVRRILVCTGPTGGHFFPAVSFAETYRAEHPEREVHLLMNRLPDFAGAWLSQSGVRIHLIRFSSPGGLFSLKGIALLIEYVLAVCKTIRLVYQLRPTLVVGFGSYSTIFAVLVARSFGIPILLHEQNRSAGR